MGANASKVPVLLPKVCNVKRESFQKKLLDINAAYGLMNHYYLILKEADQQGGRPPKRLSVVKNFNQGVIERLKKRAAAASSVTMADFELFTYLQTFEMRYNEVDNDIARRNLLHTVIGKAYEVLQLFTKNLYVLCEDQNMLANYEVPIDNIKTNNFPEPIQKE